MSNPVTKLTPGQTAKQMQQAKTEGYFERVLVGEDKEIATIAGATPDTTISEDAGIAAVEDKGFKGFYGRWMSRVLNLFQKDHGAKATAGGVAQAEEAIAVAEKSGLIDEEKP